MQIINFYTRIRQRIWRNKETRNSQKWRIYGMIELKTFNFFSIIPCILRWRWKRSFEVEKNVFNSTTNLSHIFHLFKRLWLPDPLTQDIHVTKSILDNCIAQELFHSFKRVQDKAEEHSVILNAIFERGIKEKKEREKESLMKSIDLFTFSINSSIGYLINICPFDIGWN